VTASAFLAAWFIHLLAAASPGPTILMAARIGVTDGMRSAAFLSLGFGIGIMVWALAALSGLALLFQAAPALFWTFKIAGGLFLVWIAFQMWRHASEPLPEATASGAARTPLSALRLGLATQLSNPKPALFFGAVFLGTVPPDASPQAIALLLFAMFMNEIVCTAGVARIFSLERSRAIYAGLKSAIDRVFGGILALLGLKLALT
jgi:threonine/homoserine/homoserine lactone efflux protein